MEMRVAYLVERFQNDLLEKRKKKAGELQAVDKLAFAQVLVICFYGIYVFFFIIVWSALPCILLCFHTRCVDDITLASRTSTS